MPISSKVWLLGAKLGVQIAMGGPLIGTGWSPSPYPDPRRGKESVYVLMGQTGAGFGAPVPVREIPIEDAEIYENAIAAPSITLMMRKSVRFVVEP